MMFQTTPQADRMGLTALLEGLLRDLKALVLQECRLAIDEVREELGKARSTVSLVAMAIPLVALGALLLILMVVHSLAAGGLPLWAAYGLVGMALVGTGVVLVRKAKRQATQIHVVPVRTVQTMKENLSWIKEEVTPAKM